MDGLTYRPATSLGILFAEDLDDTPGMPPTETPELPPPEPTFTAADLAAARQEGFDAGRMARAADAAATQQAALASALTAIAAGLADAGEAASAHADRLASMVAKEVMHILTRALPRLCDRFGEADVLALARMILPTMTYEPEVRVRVHPDLVAGIEAELTQLDPEIAPRITVIPTERMPRGDVRIIWKDARVVRDTRQICRDLEAALAPLTLWEPEPPEDVEPAGATADVPTDAAVKEPAHA